MEFYVIPPVNQLNLMHLGDRYFCLAQLYINVPEYRAFFKALPDDKWVTLDNGAGDHDLVSQSDLIDVVADLIPNEVIPPDVLFDKDQTIHNATTFRRELEILGLDNVEIFFCPQGENLDRYLECYQWGIKQDWITTIGLSKITVPQAFLGVGNDCGIMEARHNCFNLLKVHDLLKKPIHLLGMGDPREFDYYKIHDQNKVIRSGDSCNSIWSAMNSIDWSRDNFKRIPTPKDYFFRDVDRIDLSMINNNIKYLLEKR